MQRSTARPRAIRGPVSGLVVTALTGAAIATAPHATASPTSDSSQYPAAFDAQARGVIANLFQWNWESVATECSEHLGSAGFGAVKVSPPQESVSLPGANPAHPWWEVYQPVSYQLESRLGDRAQFAAMVRACDNAGVDVYVDAVINHMTGQSDGGTGYGGTEFPDKYTHPGQYGGQDFHHHPNDCPNPDGQVENYDNGAEVQNCELLGLADLRTGSDWVRDSLAGYLNDLIDLGVDGFRVDAAKHMDPADIRAIKDRLHGDPYLYQEVIPGGAVNPWMYEGNGDVVEFTYARKLAEQFRGDIANLETFGESWGMRPSDKSVTFVDNHDTERDGSTLSYKDGRTYLLANIFALAWGYGTPQLLSGFTFTERDSSPPARPDGTVHDVSCDSGEWTCTTRKQPIVGMVGWHNAVAGQPVRNWWSDGSDVISFSRGSSGFVAINNSRTDSTRTFTTGLPAGTHCDVITGSTGGDGGCTGTSIEVDENGNAEITVPAKSAAAIHTAN